MQGSSPGERAANRSDDTTRIVAVLGHRLRSPAIHDALAGRMDVGIGAFRTTDAAYLVVSGGATSPVVDRTEAEVMREYALQRGVDPDRVLLEPAALDTIENGFYVRRLVDDLGRAVDAGGQSAPSPHSAQPRVDAGEQSAPSPHSALPRVGAVSVVTACYHAERAAYVFRKCFGDGYEIDAARCYDEGPVGERRREAERESFRRARELLDPVPAGDLDAIRRRLASSEDYDVPEQVRPTSDGGG